MITKLKESSAILTLMGLSGFLNFFITIKVINELGPSDYGKYSWLLAISGIQAIFTDSVIKNIVPVIGNKENQKELFTQVLSYKAILFSLSTVIIASILKDVTVIIPLICFGCMYFELTAFYELNSRNITFSWITLITKISYSIVILTLISINSLNLIKVLASYGIIHMISIIYQYNHIDLKIERKHLFRLNNFSKELIVVMVLPLIILELSQFTMGGLSKIIIESTQGTRSLGIFATTLQFLIPINLYISVMEKVFRVDFVKKMRNSVTSIEMIYTSRWLLFLIIPTSILSFSIYNWRYKLIPLIFSGEYNDVINQIHYISIILILVSIFSYLKNLIVIFKKINRFNILMALTSIISICFFYKASILEDIFRVIIAAYLFQITFGFLILHKTFKCKK